MATEFPSIKYCLLFATVLLSLCLKGGASRSLSKEEIYEELNTLNKPSIKTIHTGWGDILDCVDINKQPAFDHPLLKDHKVQMKPSFFLKSEEKLLSNKSDDQSSIFMRSDEDCPEGTVPIRRTNKEDLIRVKSQSSFGESKTKYAGENLAGLRYSISGETYYGAVAILDVYNPQLTSEDQFSSSEIAVENGPDDQINGIRVGWTVNPHLYGDHKTRTFTVWTTDGYQKTGCYNQCSGFVQYDSRIYPGIPITKTSVFGGEQAEVDFRLFLDKSTGNWWLVFQGNIYVGYWPKIIFGSLSGGGNQIYWGGHVKASASGLSPNMGSGDFTVHPNYTRACYFVNMQYVTETNTLLNPKEKGVQTVLECGQHYGVKYYGFQREGGLGHTFVFGGPGGQCS